MGKSKKIHSREDLLKIQDESQKQALPEQKRVFSVSEKIRKRVHNLPDPTRPPLGYDEHKAFDRVFPYIRLPRLHPPNHGDTVIFNAPELPANQLILGDNLEVLRTLSSESVDLIYNDPPFFSGRNYNVIWGDSNEVRSFHDIWEGGIDSYIIWLNARLWEMRRVLKKTGSIYIHCDWHASHYIKCEMDKIFGYENFRNEIVWGYSGGGIPKKDFAKKHDMILRYSKTDDYLFNVDAVRQSYSTEILSRPKSSYSEHSYRNNPGKKTVGWDLNPKGKYPDDWFYIPIVNPEAKERIGYPTQKPEALLERIILSSTNEGDVVADFFGGGGTTFAVAMKHKRRFIGCDSSRVAISVSLDRLVKIGEEMSGVESNISAKDDSFQLKFQEKAITEKVPNIEVSYLGVYPMRQQIAIALELLKYQRMAAPPRFKPLLFVVAISIADDELKEAARDLNKNPQTEYDAVVSVLMLREGWDVRNISVILLFRKFSYKEVGGQKFSVYGPQVIGRGLRRMSKNPDEWESLFVVDHPILKHKWLWENLKATEYPNALDPAGVILDMEKVPEKKNLEKIDEGETTLEKAEETLDISSLPPTPEPPDVVEPIYEWQKFLDEYKYDYFKMNITEDIEQIKSLNLDAGLTTFDKNVPDIEVEKISRITKTENWTKEELKKQLVRQIHLIGRDALLEYDRNPDERQAILVKLIRDHIKKRFLLGSDVEESDNERQLRILWAMIDQIRDMFLRTELLEGMLLRK